MNKLVFLQQANKDITNDIDYLQYAIENNDRKLFYTGHWNTKEYIQKDIPERGENIQENYGSIKRKLDTYFQITEGTKYNAEVVFLQKYFDILFEKFKTIEHLGFSFENEVIYTQFISLCKEYLYKNRAKKYREIYKYIESQKQKVEGILEEK